MTNTLFEDILGILTKFETPNGRPFRSEADLEIMVSDHLKHNGIRHQRQKINFEKDDRYDIICNNNGKDICIELKKKAITADVRQMDRYHRKYPGGFIILCWRAVGAFQEICEQVQQQSPTPFALVEISRRYAIS